MIIIRAVIAIQLIIIGNCEMYPIDGISCAGIINKGVVVGTE
jgi:hypothetical protein